MKSGTFLPLGTKQAEMESPCQVPLQTLKRLPDLWLSAQRECYGVSCLILYQDIADDVLGQADRGGGAEERRAAFWGLEVSYF